MSNELVVNEFKPAVANVSGNTAITANREAQSVLGMIMAAKHFPRDKFTAQSNILAACERVSLARVSEYAFPRGGKTVSGPSIRLAETVAQCWGNLDYGVVEIERRDGESIAQAYCWDLETNVRKVMNFTVTHYRDTKAKGKVKLTDERDIYEMVANNGSRRVRACILAIVPADVTDKAVLQCRKTLTSGAGKTKEDQILDIVRAFSGYGVPQDAIEKRLGHVMSNCTPDELADLIAIGNSIKDGQSKRTDWFDLGGTEAQTDDTKALNEKFAPKMRQPGDDD